MPHHDALDGGALETVALSPPSPPPAAPSTNGNRCALSGTIPVYRGSHKSPRFAQKSALRTKNSHFSGRFPRAGRVRIDSVPNLDAANPFTPDFGQTPPEMTGRGRLLARLRAALTAGPRRPEFTSLLLGPRGTGKTVALVAFTEIAQSDGWTVIKADALLDPDPGETLDATILRRCAEAADRDDPPPRRRFTGAHAGAAGVSAGISWEAADRPALGLDRAVPRLLDVVADKGGAGVLIVADDFHNATAKGISRLASLLQQVTKIEHRPLAFLGAGLPHVAHTKLTLKGFTFFQRIHRQRIPDMTADDSVRALASPLRDGEVDCSSEAARTAAAITQGLPFAIQSMGSHLWDLAGGGGRRG